MDLDIIIGEELTAVEFVQDYLQLRFGDPLLALFAWPHIADADFVSIAHGEPGYRDALCSVIGEDVSATTFNEGSELTIEFENGTVIALSLREEDLATPEAGHFRPSPDSHELYEF